MNTTFSPRGEKGWDVLKRSVFLDDRRLNETMCKFILFKGTAENSNFEL